MRPVGRWSDHAELKEEEVRRLHETMVLAASKAKDSSRALLAVLRKLCTVFGFSYGEAWVPSRDGTVLKPGPAWPRANASFHSFRAASRKLGFLPGGGLPGQVWQRRAPIWIDRVEQAPTRAFRRHRVAEETGFRSVVGLPIVSGTDVVAVLALYSLDAFPEDDTTLEHLTATLAPLGPVVARKQVEVELAVREGQQKAVARLGLLALAESTEVEELMHEAVRLAAATLGVGHSKLVEYLPDQDAFLLRAGIGWNEGLVGSRQLGAGRGSQSGYAFDRREAVIVQDLDREKRFSASRFLRDHHIVSGLSVIIHSHQSPFGVLAVHGQQRRSFTRDDVHFLQAVANIIGAALERSRAEAELAAHRRQLESLVEKRTEQLEQSHERLRTAERLASIGTLAAGLGHDLGNTILPVLCRLDSIEASALSDSAREDLAAVRQAVEYLRQLSQGLRLFALDPEGEGASGGRTVLADWWRCVSPLLRNALPERIALRGRFPDSLPIVSVAAHRLSQAVLNMVANSAEAIAGEGGVYVWAETPAEAEFVRLGVADDGRGMSPGVRRHSLDPFFTTKRRGLSTGLGLALVHAVAKGCGGTVEIDSSAGTGTTIVLSLPIAAVERPAPTPERSVATVSLSDPHTAAYVELLLRSTGIEVADRWQGEPGDTQVWIAEPSKESLDLARRYLAGDPRRRVVFLGSNPDPARQTGAVFVEREATPEATRRLLRQVIFQLPETEHESGADSRSLRG